MTYNNNNNSKLLVCYLTTNNLMAITQFKPCELPLMVKNRRILLEQSLLAAFACSWQLACLNQKKDTWSSSFTRVI